MKFECHFLSLYPLILRLKHHPTVAAVFSTSVESNSQRAKRNHLRVFLNLAVIVRHLNCFPVRLSYSARLKRSFMEKVEELVRYVIVLVIAISDSCTIPVFKRQPSSSRRGNTRLLRGYTVFSSGILIPSTHSTSTDGDKRNEALAREKPPRQITSIQRGETFGWM